MSGIDNARLEMDLMLKDVEAVLPSLKWHQELEAPRDHDARFFVGESDEWRLVVSDFEIESQGFPPGTRGYDGAALKKSPPTMLHLTRELAQKAVEQAFNSIWRA